MVLLTMAERQPWKSEAPELPLQRFIFTLNMRRFAPGAIFISQLALLYRFEHSLQLNQGLKAFLKAA